MTIDLSIFLPAFAAGLLVLATHVPLGQEVLRRGIIFIDLAIAQVAGLGVIAAQGLGWEGHGWEVQVAAMAAAGAGALLLTWSERRFPEVQEALIGALFVVSASAGILLLANNPEGGEHLKELLVGQILWVEWSSLGPVALLYGVILALWFGLGARLGRVGFYLLFALAITASVQLVGVYLVFASLILPALGGRGLPAHRRLAAGWLLGALGYGAGLALSSLFDWPAGPLVVLALAGLAVVGMATAASLGERL
jgi:zinc/manganese transport system permease protein